MKRLVLVVAALALGACGSQKVQAPGKSPAGGVHKDQVGDACTTADGRSGYMVTAGRDLVCQAGT